MAYTSEIEKLERRVQENPQGRFFASLADAYRKDGQVARALEVVRAGLMIHPDYVSARVVLGRCLVDTGDDAAAEEAFTRVAELDGESVIALKALADIAERRGDPSAAARWASQLLNVDPGNDEAREQLARVEALGAAPPPPADEVTAPIMDLSDLAAPEPEAPIVSVAEPEPEPEPVAPVPEPPGPRRSEGIRFEPAADTQARTLEIPSTPEPEPTPILRLSGMQTTSADADALPAVAPALGLEPSPAEQVEEAPAPALAGLEATSFEPAAATDSELEREEDIELAPGGGHEYQEADASESLVAGEGSSEYQTASATDGLAAGRGDGVDPMPRLSFGVPAPELAEPEPVVTEAMAVLYLNQGHTREALGVYRELLARNPLDGRLAGKVAELEQSSDGAAGASWLAADTGGTPVGHWLQQIIVARLPDVAIPEGARSAGVPAAVSEPTTAAHEPTTGTPTRPAPDSLSLGAIFGDEPATPPAEAPAGSFDAFFGGGSAPGQEEPAAPRPRSIRHTQVDDDDLSQFQDWLKNLKK